MTSERLPCANVPSPAVVEQSREPRLLARDAHAGLERYIHHLKRQT